MSQIAGHLIVECLVAQGTRDVFGVPGESYLAVLDGFHAYRDRIRFVINRQEGGAAFMAEAVGKLTGRPGVCFVTRGPGATNASVGVHTAFQDSTPMVLFVGDVASDQRDREAFQEVEYTSFFGPSTKGMAKRVERIDDPERIPEYVARAFATAMNGRPGPVVLVLPEDMLARETAARPLALGCTLCPDLDICRGLRVRAGVFDCRSLCACARSSKNCNSVCRRDPLLFVARVNEVEGVREDKRGESVLRDCP